MFAQNPLYVAYESLLKRLHRLIADGKDDSEEADQIREVMAEPFRQLSGEEQTRLNHLSGDLYQLHGDEVFEPVDDPAVRDAQIMQPLLSDALRGQDWEAVLVYLRKGPTFLAPHDFAFYRACAYDRLGHTDTALLFMRYASEQKPQYTPYKAFMLRLLSELGRADEAIAQAYYCIGDPRSKPETFILSAFILYNSTQAQSSEGARPIYLQVIVALEQALRKVEALDDLPGELIADACVVKGYAHDALGQSSQARMAYSLALRWDAESGLAKEALDLLNQRPPSSPTGDAEQAVWRKPPSEHLGPLPRLYDRASVGQHLQLAFAA